MQAQRRRAVAEGLASCANQAAPTRSWRRATSGYATTRMRWPLGCARLSVRSRQISTERRSSDQISAERCSSEPPVAGVSAGEGSSTWQPPDAHTRHTHTEHMYRSQITDHNGAEARQLLRLQPTPPQVRGGILLEAS